MVCKVCHEAYIILKFTVVVVVGTILGGGRKRDSIF
jgi:hypothetical protein